jgi:hypothetical protein
MDDKYQYEIWKPIKGYNKYLISNHGRIISFNYIKEKILKPFKTVNGYLNIVISKNGNLKNILIHRLVAETFIENPNPEKYNQVNHIDKNKENNHYLNLEWCTFQYSNTKKYKIVDKENNEILVKNINQFCKDHDISCDTLYQTLVKNFFYKNFKLIEIIKERNN